MDHSSDIVARVDDVIGGRKLFCQDEATRALTLVRRIVADIVAEYPHLLELQEMLEGIQQHGPIDEIHQIQQQLGESVARLQDCMVELDDIGVELRDFTRGVVDFPSQREGREVRLCWRFGEPDITHWHELGAGLADRKPITAYRRSAESPARKL